MSIDSIIEAVAAKMVKEELLTGAYWIFEYDTTIFTVTKTTGIVNVMSHNTNNLMPPCRRFLEDVKQLDIPTLYVMVRNPRMEKLVTYFGFIFSGMQEGYKVFARGNT